MAGKSPLAVEKTNNQLHLVTQIANLDLGLCLIEAMDTACVKMYSADVSLIVLLCTGSTVIFTQYTDRD